MALCEPALLYHTMATFLLPTAFISSSVTDKTVCIYETRVCSKQGQASFLSFCLLKQFVFIVQTSFINMQMLTKVSLGVLLPSISLSLTFHANAYNFLV